MLQKSNHFSVPQQRKEEKLFFLGREFGLNGAFLSGFLQ